MLAERRGSFRPQPKDTVPYEVQSTDTLDGIAARYKITPSELTNLNRLSSRTVFPGQIIFIPEKSSLLALQQILQAKSVSLGAEQSSPKPGHVERVAETDSNGNETLHSSEERDKPRTLSFQLSENNSKDATNKSLKIHSKHVTDGEGVVSGVLLVTPNLIMFDPNVSDPLVVEYGMEKYGVVAQMQSVVRVAIYQDIFRMRTKDSSQWSSVGKKVDLYHAKNIVLKKSRSQGEKIDVLDKTKATRRYSSAFESGTHRLDLGPSLSSSVHDSLTKINEAGDNEDVCGSVFMEEKEDSESQNSKALVRSVSSSSDPLEGVSPTSTHLLTSTGELMDHKKLTKSASQELEFDSESRKTSVSDEELFAPTQESTSTKKKNNFEKTKERLHKGLKKLSLTDGLFSHAQGGRRMSLPAVSASFSSPKVKNSVLSSKKSKSLEDKERGEMTTTSYINMVDDKPELFVSVDKLIPRPARSFDDTPLYLCLRMGRPIQKSLHRSTPVMHFGQKMKAEYWFSIPKANVDTLYMFILRWCPQKYGDIEDINLEDLGFVSVDSEDDEALDDQGTNEQRRASWAFPWRRKSKEATVSCSSPEDWEFLDHSGKESDCDLSMPELLTPSSILNEEQIVQINKHLPARAMSCSWTLIYSTAVHGFSLKTMYREMAHYDTPVLLAIASRSNAVFGALLSCPLRISEHFYGTGESFLFTLCPEFKCYHWSGENSYFIKGNTESFSIGASEGHFGLWLDDDIFRGRTNACQTFSNPPLCDAEDFVVRSLEAWGFV